MKKNVKYLVLLLIMLLSGCGIRYTKYKDYKQVVLGFGIHTTSINERMVNVIVIGDTLSAQDRESLIRRLLLDSAENKRRINVP